jgi:prolyl oligopeptidase
VRDAIDLDHWELGTGSGRGMCAGPDRRREPSSLSYLIGDHDDRVFPAHSFKFAAALQEAQSSNHPILLRTEPDTGHGQGMPLYKMLELNADTFAFMWDNLSTDHK